LAVVVVASRSLNVLSWVTWWIFYLSLKMLLQVNLFRIVLSSRPTIGGPSTGDIINRFDEYIEEEAEPIGHVPVLAGYVLSLPITLFVMVSINWALTVIAFLPILVITAVTMGLRHRIQRYREGSRETSGQTAGFLGDVFKAVQSIRLATTEPAVVHHFEQLSDLRRRAFVKESALSAVLSSMNATSVAIATEAIVLVAARQIQDGSVTIGDLALFMTYVASESVTEFRWIFGELLAQFRRSAISIKRLVHLVPSGSGPGLVRRSPLYLRKGMPIPMAPLAHGGGGFKYLRLDGVTYHYPGTNKGITDIGFSLRKGSFNVITGRVGSGKTTLLEALLGLLPMESGAVYLERHAGCRSSNALCPAAKRVHAPGAHHL
jgi:ATP-binding cassette subfamily B protein